MKYCQIVRSVTRLCDCHRCMTMYNVIIVILGNIPVGSRLKGVQEGGIEVIFERGKHRLASGNYELGALYNENCL